MQSLYFKLKQYIYILKLVILIKEWGNPPLSKVNRMESNIPNYYFFSKIMNQVILLAQRKSWKSFVETMCLLKKNISSWRWPWILEKRFHLFEEILFGCLKSYILSCLLFFWQLINSKPEVFLNSALLKIFLNH